MPRRQFVSLELDKIEDGQFIKDANRLLQEMSRKMIAYGRTHEARAKGAKATLTLQICIVCENPDPTSEMYSLKATPKLSLPIAPVTVANTHATEGQTGEPELQISYSDEPIPRQSQTGMFEKDDEAA